MNNNVFLPADILLPKNADFSKWAVIACDQFTSDQAYWDRVRATAEGSVSTIKRDAFTNTHSLDTVTLTGDDIRLEEVTLENAHNLKEILRFYMGDNTDDRRQYIVDNLRIEEDLA